MRLNDYFFRRHLDDEEEIVHIVHKYWLLGAKALFWPTLIFLGLWVLLYYMPDRYVFYGIAFMAMVTVLWWIRNFLDYYLDAWIITNKGIIDVEWHGWFHRASTRVLYSDVQAVSYEINGIAGTLLRYGTIEIEKISTGDEFAMEYVRHPRKIESLVLEMLEAYMHKKNLKDATVVQGILAEFIAGTLQTKDFVKGKGGEEENDDEKYAS